MEGGCGDVMLSAKTTKKPRCCTLDSLEVRARKEEVAAVQTDVGKNVVEQTHPDITCCCIHNTGEQMEGPWNDSQKSILRRAPASCHYFKS